MVEFQKEGVKIIDDLVHHWTSKYSHLTQFVEKVEKAYKFLCEFSLPTPNKPIPTATVKIFFFLEPSNSKNVSIKYRFENDSLIHTIDKTVHPAKMEVSNKILVEIRIYDFCKKQWIEKFLDKKKITSKILFLGTEFEATRIKDERIDRIIEQMNYRKEVIDNRRLSKGLLNPIADDIFNQKDDKENERDQMETMRKALFDVFRSFDKEDLGIVSFNEFEEILKSLNLNLSQSEFKELVSACDLNKNGMIEYSEWIPIGSELIFGWWLKNRTEEYMRVKQEEFLFEAVMILYNDEIHLISKTIIQECTKADEDELGTIKIGDLKKLLEKKSELLTPPEIEGILKFIKKRHPQEFPYKETYNFILEFKINLIKHGLMESSLNEMDLYLRELFKKYEKDKLNLITLSDLGEALRNSDKIILSNVQIYMLQSFVEKDENNMVDYNVSSRFLGDMIKRFFSPALLQKKANLFNQKPVRFDELMDGWTEESIKLELTNIFHKFDENKDNLLDQGEYKKCVKASKIRITDEEIELMMQSASKSKNATLKLEEFVAHFYSILRFIRIGVALEKLAGTP